MSGPPGVLFRIIKDQRVLFLMVGGVNTVVGALWFVLFDALLGHRWNGWGHYPALVLTYVFSILCAFVLYRKVVFRVHGHVWRDLMRFARCTSSAFVINLVLLGCSSTGCTGPPFVSQFLIVFVTTALSWFGHSPSLSAERVGRGLTQPRSRRPAARADDYRRPSSKRCLCKPTCRSSSPPTTTSTSSRRPSSRSSPRPIADFELVIADHSSTDEPGRRSSDSRSDPRVTLLRTPAGGGAPANWTRVSEAATGDYLKLVCGDDLLEPSAWSSRSRCWTRTPASCSQLPTHTSWTPAVSSSPRPGAWRVCRARSRARRPRAGRSSRLQHLR